MNTRNVFIVSEDANGLMYAVKGPMTFGPLSERELDAYGLLLHKKRIVSVAVMSVEAEKPKEAEMKAASGEWLVRYSKDGTIARKD